MADTLYSALGTVVSVLGTELQSITTGSTTGLGATGFDNTSAKKEFALAKLVSGTFGSSRSSGALIDLYGVYAADGTNYDSTNAASAELLCSFPLDNTTSSLIVTRQISLVGPVLMKFFAVNRTGQTTPATGITIGIYPFYIVTA